MVMSMLLYTSNDHQHYHSTTQATSGWQFLTYIGVGSVLVIVMVLMKILSSFFSRLEQEREYNVSESSFKSPTSLTRVPAPSLFDAEATKSLSVVIPAYNEEERLPGTLEETIEYLQKRRNVSGPSFTYEIIVVDDGSKDKTSDVAFEYVKKHGLDAVRVLSLPMNKGKGHAVKAGMMCSRGKEVLFMDADGATAVSEIEKLETRLDTIVKEEGNGDVRSPASWERMPGKDARWKPMSIPSLFEEKAGFVLGSRAHLQNEAMAKRTAIRNVLMHGFHALVTLVVGNTIRDTQCGFKV